MENESQNTDNQPPVRKIHLVIARSTTIVVATLVVLSVALASLAVYEMLEISKLKNTNKGLLAEVSKLKGTIDDLRMENEYLNEEVFEYKSQLISREPERVESLLSEEEAERVRIISRNTHRVADIKQIQLALELYFDAYYPDGYPPTESWEEDLVSAEIIVEVPKDPATGESYTYCRLSINNYHLGGELEESTEPASSLADDADLISKCLNGIDPVYDVTP